MMLIGEQVLLRIYLDSADRAPHTPSFDRIVRKARAMKLAGCTVLAAIGGFVPGSPQTTSQWSLARHEPVIVEIIDTSARIAQFIDDCLGDLMLNGLATLERAAVARYRHRHAAPSPPTAVPAAVEPLSGMSSLTLRSNMKIDDTGLLLRIFIGESDRAGHEPLHHAIVAKARELGLAGATVLRGTQGFGAHSVIHKSALLDLSADLPIVVEIVDAQSKIERLLPHLDEMVQEGLITMENVRILTYRG